MSDLTKLTGGETDPKGGRASTASQSGGKRRRSKTARRGKKSHGRGRTWRVCKRKRCHKKPRRGGKCSGPSKRGGAGVVATAALPFGMLALQKFFQTRKGRKNLKKASKTMKSSVKGVSRSVKSARKSIKRSRTRPLARAVRLSGGKRPFFTPLDHPVSPYYPDFPQ